MPASQSGPLWDCFAVVGLPQACLQTVQGDRAGFVGSEQRYKPALVDSLPSPVQDVKRPPPPQLPTVSN